MPPESEFELRREIGALGARVEFLTSVVRDLAHSIRAMQKPMTIPQFAERTGMPESRVRRLVREGSIKSFGRKVRKIPATELASIGM